MDSSLEGKVGLVTGAGRGIGRAIALKLAQAGVRVAVNDISPDNLYETLQMIRDRGGSAESFEADVSSKMQTQGMLGDILETFDGLDFLINNAGVEPKSSLLELDEWDWDRTLAVNLKGPFLLIQSAARIMAESGGGVIVNIGSIAGRAHGLKDRSAYVASKMGLIGLTREAARELASYGIRVNAVCPGVVETEMTAELRENEEMMKRWREDIPLGRLGLPDEIAEVVRFLCSDDARYLTGQTINVDGGKVMC